VRPSSGEEEPSCCQYRIFNFFVFVEALTVAFGGSTDLEALAVAFACVRLPVGTKGGGRDLLAKKDLKLVPPAAEHVDSR
jgi:hypothetical protein